MGWLSVKALNHDRLRCYFDRVDIMKSYLREVFECSSFVIIALAVCIPGFAMLWLCGYHLNDRLGVSGFLILLGSTIVCMPFFNRIIPWLLKRFPRDNS